MAIEVTDPTLFQMMENAGRCLPVTAPEMLDDLGLILSLSASYTESSGASSSVSMASGRSSHPKRSVTSEADSSLHTEGSRSRIRPLARIVSPSPRAAPPRNGFTALDSGAEHLSYRGQSYDSPDRPSTVLGTAMMAQTVGTMADSSHFLVLADQSQINQADE